MSCDDPWKQDGEYLEMHSREIENIKLQCALVGVLVGVILSTFAVSILWVVY